MTLPNRFGDQSSLLYPALAPAPVPIQTASNQTASASELFPFDPTLAAIEKRRNTQQGIMSLT